MRQLRLGLLALGICCLGACQSEPQFFSADAYPQKLSAWNLLSADLVPSNRSTVYRLNTALFTDYAQKLRTITQPVGERAAFDSYEAFEYPPGTVVTKTFYYPVDDTGRVILTGEDTPPHPGTMRVLETRLLVRQEEGWDALPYVWDGDDAYLKISGELLSLDTADGQALSYLVPSRNQCASCHASDHTSGMIQPIGLKARHLNRDDEHGQNQLQMWHDAGQLEGLPAPSSWPRNVALNDETATLNDRARSYLDINCGHCHNPRGAADTSGLMLDSQERDSRAMGVCKPPIASGRGSGGRLYSIVPGDADASILTFRMASSDPAVMMPELGRSTVHSEAVALVGTWIDQLAGACL